MISILLPVKDEERYICECLDSIRDQTLQDWELIIVDDHSSDQSVSFIRAHELFAQGKIRLVTNRKTGLIEALKTGWQYVNRPFVTRMDGDDRMVPDRLEAMIKELEVSTEPMLVTGLVRYFPEDNITTGYRRYEYWLNQVQLNQSHRQNIYRECVFASPNWMMKTADLQAIGAFEDLRYPEDYSLALKCYDKGVHFRGIAKTTLYWRHHPDRMSLHHRGYHQRSFFELKITHFVQSQYRSHHSVIIWGKSEKARLTAQVLRAHSVPYHILTQDQVHQTQNHEHPLVLIAIYPDLPNRRSIRLYLNKMGLTEGISYWFL